MAPMKVGVGWKLGLMFVGIFMWITSTLMMHEIISPQTQDKGSFIPSNMNHLRNQPSLQLEENVGKDSSTENSIKHSTMLRGELIQSTASPVDQRKLTPEVPVIVHDIAPPLPPPVQPNQVEHIEEPLTPIKPLETKEEENKDDVELKKKFTKLSSGCDMVENVDYPTASNGQELMITDLTIEECCGKCEAMHCDVAVYSSDQDSPPHACWVKSRVMKEQPTYKFGVKSCIRSGSITPNSLEISPQTMADYYPYIKRLYKSHSSGDSSSDSSSSSGSYVALPGTDGVDTREETDPAALAVLNGRCDAIRNALMHCWRNYKEHAWGMDNVSPISGRGSNSGFNHAVTMVDTLDTLWLMGLKNEFNDAKEWLKRNMREKIGHIGGGTSLFETTIRSFGGLLAAYDLSNDPLFKDLSVLLGNKISDRTSPDGVSPYTFSGGAGGMGCPSLAESGTMQVEMNYLSKITGDKHYATKANNFYATVKRKPSLDGLWPNCWGRGRGRITFGADGDSFYEYLIKGWLQSGKTDDNLWNMYNNAVDGMEKWLVVKSPDGLTFLNNLDFDGKSGGRADVAMEHLACFVPGWLALGIPYQSDEVRKARHLKLAEELAYTCYRFYEAQPSGIGPERVKRLKIDLSQTDTKEYILRPEAIEGWWYMYELTGNNMYREWGWKTFLNFEKHLKAPHGYASLKNVRSPGSGKMDRMESFFLAETLKYLYLLQDPTRPIRLDTHVFNTEAHPFRI